MKFEIDTDDKTVELISLEDENIVGRASVDTLTEIELCLQTLKTKSNKIINREIQSVQDSKNQSKTITQIDKQQNEWILDASIDVDSIEQNQKIVDGLVALYHSSNEMYDSYKEQLDNYKENKLNPTFLQDCMDKELFVINHIIDMIKYKTGKELKDL